MKLSSCSALVVLAATGLVLAACGGDDAQPPPGTPAGQEALSAPTEATTEIDTAMEAQGAVSPTDIQGAVSPTDVPQQGMQLVREVFSFRGSGRDPFMSLLRSGDVRPLLQDLRVTSITYNPRFPSNSIAVLRDTTVNRRYTVRVGDELGRLRILEIRLNEVVVVQEEFGAERQVVLRQRRRQEGQP